MDIAVIIVGVNGWKEWTLPAWDSIKKHDPSLRVVIVDNASTPPYPIMRDALTSIPRMQTLSSYTAAINFGIRSAGKADWYLVLNNDIRFDSPVSPVIEKLDNSFIYGRQIIEGNGYRWLGLWLALIPRQVWERVGEFDENFKMCGFDDADYCVRAKRLGVDTLHVDLPIHHFWGKTRWGIPGYKVARQENIEYFERKHGFRPDDYKVIAE